MQPVDFTTLTAACSEIRANWLPSRLEQVYQRDRYTIAMALRTLKQRDWLQISWHPQAAHICIGDPPPRSPDTFTFSQQLIHQLNGLALVAIEAIAPWERVIDLQFARRPGETALYHVYAEIMGKYSNVILTDANNIIITAAHQVSQQQSSVRPIQTAQPYETPPKLTGTVPSLNESQERWQERVSLVPGAIKRQLLKSYSGLSAALLELMLLEANIAPETSTDTLNPDDWRRLFERWQEWLQALDSGKFQPAWTKDGYTVMGWGAVKKVKNIQELLNRYYSNQIDQQLFSQLRHQLSQKLNNILAKLQNKAQTFKTRLQQSDQADEYRQKADLLMAHLQNWEPGMKEIILADFDTNLPVAIALLPDKNAVQNAQGLYKQHQKLKRARAAVEPLLLEVQIEIEYLEQVEAAIAQIDTYQTAEDLRALEEIREELIGQKYLEDPEYRSRSANEPPSTNFHRYLTPNGFEVLIGRNNRQNDQLTFRVAGDYDLWFHAQEIPGSHVLLRLEPGAVAEEADLQFVANLAAYYSRARQSEQVPVVYTQLKHVYKPKGAKPGIAIYKQETILWGKPQMVVSH
ncbi:fibronectin-binding A domain-containing protein [Nostoc commune NIES-4072]|uniref:Rqc2 homolog RqcH n=1 Tax=Nostoc commune NIES-4072 TaxID=2005467 RepID=A0A2R5FQP7_NOSCO|nr:NFACT family protein [Nostoc commune]BBD67929.1 fibronectin-binding A domain-containing protein [Nostoc commune HK-02]GBG21086.1 fibronectin-binding A domain-containing protein [Nostoc commune NIES-4072]